MARLATAILSILVGLITLAVSGSINADDQATASKMKSKPPAVAKSHDELAKLLFAALDAEDYTTIQQLMAPVTLLEELGAPSEERENYATYLERLPKLAKAYREFLDQKKILPLKGRTFSEYDDRFAKEVNGKRLQNCSGIRLIENRGKDNERTFEIVDQAVGYDGRWYIGRLVCEAIEEKLKIPDDKDTPAKKE